jgi:hypothetical protein
LSSRWIQVCYSWSFKLLDGLASLVSAQTSCEHHGKFVIIIPLGGTHSKWPWLWALLSPLGEEHRGSWAPSLESFLNGDVAPLGVNFGKQILSLSCAPYLFYWLFACETNFLGFVSRARQLVRNTPKVPLALLNLLDLNYSINISFLCTMFHTRIV